MIGSRVAPRAHGRSGLSVILVFVTGPVGVAASVWGRARRVMAGCAVRDRRRLFALPRGDDNGRSLRTGIHRRAPSATILPDAGTSGHRVLPDGVCGGGDRNVGTSPVVRAMTVVMVVGLLGSHGLVSGGGHDVYVAAIKGAVATAHRRHGHSRGIECWRSPAGVVAITVAHCWQRSTGGRHSNPGSVSVYRLCVKHEVTTS